MRFLQKNNVKKTIIVISDIHLGAGTYVDGRRNHLEDFTSDQELVEFLAYFSEDEYADREVELIINGDFLDFLAVPFVEYFDDEFWSEKAALEKLKLIMNAHHEVFEALNNFISKKKKKVVYIIGNHDAEFVFEGLQTHFLNSFSEDAKKNITIRLSEDGEYIPVNGIIVKHGHEYEIAHQFHVKESIVQDEKGNQYFLPPWGSYYVTRVINKFKEERHFINAVRPIKKFLVDGLIHDTLFTIRFIFSTCYYFVMVRFIYYFRQDKNFKNLMANASNELELFQDYEELTGEFFQKRDDVKALIVGHTHDPIFRSNLDGTIFINTGTWTKMYNLDFGKRQNGELLTYAQIDIREEKKSKNNKKSKNKNLVENTETNKSSGNFEHLDLALNIWKGRSDLPFTEF
ncbi:MAG: metallophosphoesterase [Halobacteriovoraceae bacterium]|nr:metallophosphoesterase [Halobacteriovoraceae bacterium]